MQISDGEDVSAGIREPKTPSASVSLNMSIKECTEALGWMCLSEHARGDSGFEQLLTF